MYTSFELEFFINSIHCSQWNEYWASPTNIFLVHYANNLQRHMNIKQSVQIHDDTGLD